MTKNDDVLSVVDGCLEDLDVSSWEGTLKEYLPLVVDNPSLNELSHSRICRMIEGDGVSFDEKDDKKKNPMYEFFKKELFGLDHVTAQIMQYFKAAAAGSEVSRRILLLWGPTSSGKSQFAIMLKKGLEKFSKTKEGAVYGIKGCPMHENPLNAIPLHARDTLRKKFGLVIEGELCPRCAYILENELKNDFWKIPVERFFMSEMNRIGVGTFQPGDTKCITGDSLVLSEKGLYEISDFGLENEEKINENIILDDGTRTKSSMFFRYDDRDVLKIKTNLGYEIGCSYNHPLMTVNSFGDFCWKNAEDLSIGDTLVMTKGQGFSKEKVELPENKLNITWTENFAKFLGLYVAEGCFYKPGYSTMEITNQSPEIHKIVFDAMKEIGLEDKCKFRKDCS